MVSNVQHRDLLSRAVVNSPSASRFLLWVDAIGTYLVCPGSEVRFGQAVPGCQVEVPLVADVSRHQLTVRRDEEGYVVDPIRETSLNGRLLAGPSSLRHDDMLAIGPVAMRFARPHPLTASARLDFVSYHRTRPSSDAVILLADACLLGPDPRSHVVCRDWLQQVMICRQADQWFCHAPGRFEIEGRPCHDRGLLGLDSRVVGDDFSFTLEAVK